MSRTALLLSALALPAVVSAVVMSCNVGDVSQNGPNVASDAAVAVSDAGGGGEADALAADPDCEPAATPNGNGEHNAGSSCTDSDCHDGNTANVPLWTLSGTMFLDLAGTTPLAGGTLIVTDANAQEIKLTTASNGNFYTGDAIAFPVQVKASRCPNSLSMNMAITTAEAGCNQGGCHAAGNRIYVPE